MFTSIPKWGRSSVSGGNSAAMWIIRSTPCTLIASSRWGDLGNVPPVDLYAVQVGSKVRTGAAQVEADHLLAALRQLAHNAVANESRAAGDHSSHWEISLVLNKKTRAGNPITLRPQGFAHDTNATWAVQSPPAAGPHISNFLSFSQILTSNLIPAKAGVRTR